MACGEYGMGRMSEPDAITNAIKKLFHGTNSRDAAINCKRNQKLAGKKALVTSGPTHEPLAPVRYIANRTSGRQGCEKRQGREKEKKVDAQEKENHRQKETAAEENQILHRPERISR